MKNPKGSSMKQGKKQKLLKISETTARITLCCLFLFNAYLFTYFGIINRGNVPEREPLYFIETWTVSDESGSSFTTQHSFKSDFDLSGQVSVTATLPEDIKDNEYFFFDIKRDVAVYVDENLRKDFIEKRDVNVLGGLIKSFYMMVPLQESDSGKEVKMVISSVNKGDQIFEECLVSTRYGSFSYLMQKIGLSFFLASIIMIFSLVAFIVSVVLRIVNKMRINMLYGALTTFVLSAWIITDSYLYPFTFGTYHVNGILNYMFCFMLPFAPAIYLNSVQRGRYQVSMSVIMIISSINAVLWPVLHFCGILSFFVVRIPVNIALVGICGYVIILLVVDAARGNAASYRYTFIGFFGFLICCILELVLLIVITTLEEPIPMVMGLGFLLAFVVMQQVDDLRKINLEKQHAIDISEAKTRFLASMSHEIRTPINAILGMNEMILRENSDHVISDYARNIKTSGKMLLMLVNDVLDFSKIEAGKLEINEARFLMSDMLYDVISLVKERADEKRLALETEITAKVPNEMLSDEFRIRQILVNLINNAVKYTEKGTVTLKIGGTFLQDDTYMLDLRVKDTGKGIKKEEQENLFEAFSRADVKSNVNIESTGLGLAIVKSIVDSMNGEVGVESEYGVGSEFYVKLPVKAISRELLPDDFMEARSSHEAAVDHGLFTAPDAKILAVDDNQSNLTIVKLFLKRTGIVPDLCNNGNTAVEMSRKKKYDLILLDHMMPDPDGIKTLHLIRNDEKTLNKDTKAVVLTANAVAGSRQMYMDEGFDDYLTKPLDSGVLEQTVMKMLPKEKVTLAEENEIDENVEKKIASEMRESQKTASEKVEKKKDIDGIMEFDETMEFMPQQIEQSSAFKEKLTSIEGLDYEKALHYSAGDEGFLAQIVDDIASEGIKRVDRLKESLAAGDLKSYQIEAHAAKSNMATLGLSDFSERAKKHEFAAKENNMAFIREDSDDFIDSYLKLCQRLL